MKIKYNSIKYKLIENYQKMALQNIYQANYRRG